VRRLTFTAQVWQIKLSGGAAVPIAQAALGLLAMTTLISAVLAAWALRRGAAQQVKSKLRERPVASVVALSLACFHPELPALMSEGFDALALSCYSIVMQDIPWLILDSAYIDTYGWGSLAATVGLHVAVATFKVVRVGMLYLGRRAPREISRSFFRFYRGGDVVPVVVSALQFGLVLALALHAFWLLFRAEESFGERYGIATGPLYSAESDALLSTFLAAVLAIVSAGVLVRLSCVIYFARHPAFAHRGIYRHSMLASFVTILSCLEGSVFTVLAKSNIAYKVSKLATSACSLIVYDVPITMLVAVYYFAMIDFNELGVTFAGNPIEGILRATAVISVLVTLFKIFLLTLMKATLADSIEENPFMGPACLCGGPTNGERRDGSRHGRSHQSEYLDEDVDADDERQHIRDEMRRHDADDDDDADDDRRV